MIHDTQRVSSLRSRADAQISLASQLQAKIKKGKLPILTVARNQLGDIEEFFIADLDKTERTPQDERRWLDNAERVLQIWTSELQWIEDRFKQSGGGSIQNIGG
jgi:hypothetical protein